MRAKPFTSRFLQIAFYCIFLLLSARIRAQTSAVLSGRVQDATGAALSNASLTITGPSEDSRIVPIASDGAFRIEGLAPGSYELRVASAGLAGETRKVNLRPRQAETLTITMRPPVLSQTVDVVATADAVSGSVTKMDVPLLETPQAITLIDRSQIDAQSPLSFQEALRYTAGVATDLYGFDARGDWAAVRGDELWGQYLNGLKMLFGYYNNIRPDPWALERIEVMRGPSSVLFGQSGFGGAVNLVSKRPLPQHRREVQIQLGSYRRRQIGLDVTGPLNSDGKLLYRLVGLGRDSNTQVDHVPDNRLLFAPSLTWRPRAGTSLTVLSNFQQDKSGSSIGFFPWQGTLLPNAAGQIPTNTFISEPGFDEYRTEQLAAGYLFQHQFNSRWTVRQNFNYTESNASYQTLYTAFDPSPTFNEDSRSVERNIYVSKPKARSPVIDTQIDTRFRTGSVRHNILFGVDYQKATIDPLWGYDLAPAIDVFAPKYGNYIVPPLYDAAEERQDQLGVYAQDHLQFGERWSLMLGIRKDRATSNTEGDPESRNEDGAVTGRAGLVYSTASGIAPYFSFSQSFQPFAGADVFNKPYDPIRAKQWEAGVKYQPGNGENLLSGAIFDIREKNRLTPDPQNPLNSVQLGEARIRGIELEGRTKPFRTLNLIANYSFLDARISESKGPDLGKRLPVIPKHLGSLWGIKSFQAGNLPGFFSAGGGIRYNGSTFDGDDGHKTLAYTLYDLMFAYDRSAWRFSVNVANLTDKVYLASCLSRGDCFYGIRRAVTATIRYRF